MLVEPSPAALILVSTPIGNLADMTFRGVEVLKSASAILAEDTRHSRRLLSHYGISTPTIAYHDHNKERVTPGLIERLQGGETLALISDAGTPGISDPGFYLVRAAIAAGIVVSAVPGANSVLPSLILSGLPTDAFAFDGFLPRKKGELARIATALIDETRTSIFFVSPYQLLAALAAFNEAIPDRRIAVARELTKLHEEIARGTAFELSAHFGRGQVRGEIVLVVEGAGRRKRRK